MGTSCPGFIKIADPRRFVSIHGSSTSSLVRIGIGVVDLADPRGAALAAPLSRL
jgi:hypothetical protein